MAIRLIVGPPGTGKSYTMLCAVMQEFRRTHCQIMANMVGLRAPEAMYIEASNDFDSLASGAVLLDEAGIFFGSRTWQERTRRQMAAFAQVRKDGLDLWCTTQHESRVDTILRENCSEIWRMRKFGPFFCAQIIDPHNTDAKARTMGRRWFSFNLEVARLYDTFEKIDESGRGGGGSNVAGALSVVARRREAARTRQRAQRTRQRLIRETIYRPGRNSLVLTPEAQEVQRWLIYERWGLGGVCDHLPAQEIQRELSRRRWLKRWGLTWEDVPDDCSFDRPWLAGYDPAAVAHRNSEARKEELARELIEHSDRGSRRRSKQPSD